MRKIVRTLFNHDSMVSVRDYEIEECIRKNDAMHIVFEDKVMTMDPKSLEDKIVMTTGPFPSKTGGKGYMLHTYKWEPNISNDD